MNYGLAAVLGLVGLKMIAEWWFPHEANAPLIPGWVSLLVIAVLLGIAVAASAAFRRREE